MHNLTDRIEAYLKQLFANNIDRAIEIQRYALAQAFSCVPSQINYVLRTRFTPEQGYLIETRRGGGGYIRIIKLAVDQEADFNEMLHESIGDSVSQTAGEGLIARLHEEGLLTAREFFLLKAVMDRNTIMLRQPERSALRSRILKAILCTIMRDDF